MWEHVRAGRQSSKVNMATDEKECFNDMWSADNLPLISDEGQPTKESFWGAVISNIVFILMQSLLQLPALFTFVWYLVNNGVGSIAYTSDAQSSWKNLASTQFRQAFVLFCVYAAGSILWQVLAFSVPARRYLLLASMGYFCSCIAAVWATFIVQVFSSHVAIQQCQVKYCILVQIAAAKQLFVQHKLDMPLNLSSCAM